MAKYFVFCHRYPLPLAGVESISIRKELRRDLSYVGFDGRRLKIAVTGRASIGFTTDMSHQVLLGDFIYILRQNDDAIASLASNLTKRDLVDFRGQLVFQGLVVDQTWKQSVPQNEGTGFLSNWNLIVEDLSVLLKDSTLFASKILLGKINPALADNFRAFLRQEYQIDIARSKYQREDIVNKLLRTFIEKGLTLRGGNFSNLGGVQSWIGQGISQQLGLTFDKAIDAFDFVYPARLFHGCNPMRSIWDYVSELTSDPLYEFFVTEDSGRVVFRRAAWNKIGSFVNNQVIKTPIIGQAVANSGVFRNLDNKLLANDRSHLHKIQDNQISHVEVLKTERPMKNMVGVMHDGDYNTPMTMLDKAILRRYGMRFQTVNIEHWYPRLTSSSSTFGTRQGAGINAALNAATGDWFGALEELGRIKGQSIDMKQYNPVNVQEEVMKRRIADMFRAEITLRNWQPDISIGDHVQIADAVLFGALDQSLQALQTGFRGYGNMKEDHIYYVTSKRLSVNVNSNGVFTETFQLGLNYGGLEFSGSSVNKPGLGYNRKKVRGN